MVKSLRYLFLMLFTSLSGAAFAQSGAISGKVLDETKQPIIGAIVEVSQGGSVRGGAATDEDGAYTIKPLNPATDYQVTVKYTGYQEIRMDKVQITVDRTTYQNFNMKVNPTEREEVLVIEYKVPLIKKDEPGTTTTFTGEQIKNMATINTNDVASLSGGTYQQKSGSGVNIGGARTNGTLYIIDGMQVTDASVTNLPPGSIDQMSVITSGLPAKYGDALGGVINITTRGASPEHRGDVRLEHSVDGYNHNLASFNFTGPLFKKKIDSTSNNKRTVLGYALGGQYSYDADDDPNYFKNYVVKQSVLDEIRQRPFIQTASSTGGQELRYATDNITMGDLETSKQRINAESQTARLNGRLDYQLSDNANLSAGGNFTYINQRNYGRYYSLFSPEAIPAYKSNTTRAFLRYTQKLGSSKITTDEETKNTSVISNAYYSVQADYQRDYAESEDKDHKKNPFYYNYIGKYDIKFAPFYLFGYDSVAGINMMRLETNRQPDGVSFQRSEMNPYLANYTSQVFDFAGDSRIASLDELSQRRGLLNGQVPADVIGSNVYANVGRGMTGYSYRTNEQFAFNVDANFDLQAGKTKHAIGFGLYYQQRSERFFGFDRPSSSVSIWNAMRLLANQHLIGLDYNNPTYIKNGQTYTWSQLNQNGMTVGPTDTVLYQTRFDTGNQSTFSKNLREKLAQSGLDNGGVYGTSYLNIDALDPSLFSLDMFSADELINQGEAFVNYYGYDYTGKRLNGQVNFNDWFTKKDANGNYTREIGAFRPNYTAGYIMDKFELGSGTLFNVGLRVERFDANTKVLKDPYSLYAVETVGTSDARNLYNNGTPSNMGKDYVVYVADNSADNPQVVGYRNGDDWYDPYGRPLADPSDIQRLYSGGRAPQPYLQRNNADKTRALTMRDSTYNPTTSFTDYKPQVNVMPRLSFSFPIAEQSMFYAHYDVIVQRPKSVGQIYATPTDYYYINQKSSEIIGNPDLKPEKMFDYEIGFQQQLNKFSAVTLTGFYKERKDMIQVRPYLYAWPTTYFTYGNRDFSTTKGFIFKYDLRRINHLMLFATYTLQFAEGTGSSAAESNGGRSDIVQTGGLLQNLIGASLPNLRFAYPLTIDSRHTINVNIDYRYDKGEGPIVGKTHILENAGLNLIFRTRSGEPYTRYINAIPGNTTIIGGVQNARLPWHYMFDLRFDKQFDIYFGKKDAEAAPSKNRKSLGMMAFVYISNLLNTQDVLGVHRYTGRPDDNGYLVSPNGQQALSTQYNPQSYYDLYSLSNQNPGYLNNPRRINVGLQFNF